VPRVPQSWRGFEFRGAEDGVSSAPDPTSRRATVKMSELEKRSTETTASTPLKFSVLRLAIAFVIAGVSDIIGAFASLAPPIGWAVDVVTAALLFVVLAPALTPCITLTRAREGADGQAVVCPLLRGSSPTRGVAPKQHRGLRRAFSPAFRTGSLDPLARGRRRIWRSEIWKNGFGRRDAARPARAAWAVAAAAGCTMERSPAEFMIY